VRVSAIGLGCGGFGGIGSAIELFGQGESEEDAFTLMDRAVELGINYFDTADSYGGGRSEEMVGRWLVSRGVRDDIVVSTKTSTRTRPDQNSGGLSRRHVVRAVDESLRRLQTDRIDIYLGHQVDPDTDLEETIRAFDDLVRGGKVCYVGCCNIEGWRVAKSLAISERLGTARFECIQNEYNLLHRTVETEVLPLVSEERLAFTAFSPLAGGWLTGKYRHGHGPPAGSRMSLRPDPYVSFQTSSTYQAIESLRTAAANYGASMGAVAFAWVLSHPAVTSALAGPRNLDQMATLAEALELTVTPEDRARIVASLESS
jgi:aryl-alcohol dehydrogenase-like predicted oxidoreductase